jgi:recombination protein RecR
MEYGSETLASLVKLFARMPGIGRKTAQRLALHLLRAEAADVERLGSLILKLKETVRFCRSCRGITESEECAICKDLTRNRELICVVEEPQDVLVLENTRQFNGLYHVLHGVLSPIDGIGPDDLNLGQFEERVRANKIKEVVVATNSTVEGETTALYIARLLESLDCTVTRLARGLPMGGTLEFADDVTLARALERREKL